MLPRARPVSPAYSVVLLERIAHPNETMSLDDPRTSVKERRWHDRSHGHFPPRQSNIQRKIARQPRGKSLSHLRPVFLALLFVLPVSSAAQEAHSHAAPEKLGVVSFQLSCQPEVQRTSHDGVP